MADTSQGEQKKAQDSSASAPKGEQKNKNEARSATDAQNVGGKHVMQGRPAPRSFEEIGEESSDDARYLRGETAQEGHGTPGESGTPEDHVDDSANTYVYPADLGYTVTSHGDGTPSISSDYLVAREEEAERNANPDARNEAVARELGLLD